MRERLLYVYNPYAGKGLSPARITENIVEMTRRGWLVTAFPTQKDTDYQQLFADFGEGRIICSGGDGMLNAVVNALLPTGTDRPFGYLPAGTTNDFARSIGISRDDKQALAGALAGEVRRVDAGKLNDRYFAYVAAFGAFTNISYVTSQNVKNMFGYFAYVLQGIRELSDLKTTHVKVEIEAADGTSCVIEDDFIVGMITNSASVAGFKSIGSGDFSCDDGLFELALLKKPERLADLHCLLGTLHDGTVDCDCILYAQSRRITIEAAEEIAYTLDGEYGGSFSRASIQNLHRQLAIRV